MCTAGLLLRANPRERPTGFLAAERMGACSAFTQESCMAVKTKGVTRVPGRESKCNAKTTVQLQVYDVQSQAQLNNTLSRNCSWVAELARRSKEWLLQKQNSRGGQGTQGTSMVITFYSLTWRKGTYMFIVLFCCVCVCTCLTYVFWGLPWWSGA